MTPADRLRNDERNLIKRALKQIRTRENWDVKCADMADFNLCRILTQLSKITEETCGPTRTPKEHKNAQTDNHISTPFH